MSALNRYKWPIITLIVTIVVLTLMIAIGLPLGLISSEPDGLERVVIDSKGESWLEGLSSPWKPILGWIQSEYVAGILGVVLTLVIMISVLYLIVYIKKKKRSA